LFYLMAFDHLVEYRVLNSTTPNRHYQFVHQLDQYGLKYTLSTIK
jgi:hypothetical protein